MEKTALNVYNWWHCLDFLYRNKKFTINPIPHGLQINLFPMGGGPENLPVVIKPDEPKFVPTPVFMTSQ